MSHLCRVAAAVVCAAWFGIQVPAQEKPAPAKPPAAAQKAEAFVVVQAGDSMEVIAKDKVAAKKQELAEQFKAQMTKFEKDKKAAAEAKQPFHEPTPKAVTLETLPGEYKTRAEADAALAKHKAEHDKAKEKAREPEKPKHPAPPAPNPPKKKARRSK